MSMRYNRDSVERTLDVHVPGAWRREPNHRVTSDGRDNAYTYYIDTVRIGTVRFTTLREAYAFVVGSADKAARQEVEENRYDGKLTDDVEE